ncbi:MAG TPA: CheR family methyltransferase [Gemmataceae bacterium]|nr:CheR family methyltransferase [Gemmataceae bacterium]
MTWSDPASAAVARFVAQRTGLSFAGREGSAELGIRKAMGCAHVADVLAYLELLATDARAFDNLLDELTVGETYFFREPQQFAFLRNEVLPALARRGHPIRAWSAGCASGEEAYSLAILFEELGLADRSSLLATDICRAALARAWRATYGAWSLRGEGAVAAIPYLRPAGKLYQVEERIRRRVAFQHLNLALDVYPSFATGTWGLDLILCRNVLIYFDCDTVRSVAGRLFDALAEGGWLLTASADPLLTDMAPFEVITTNEGVFYRRSADKPAVLYPKWKGEAPAEPGLDSAARQEPRPPGQAKPRPDRDAEAASRDIRALANRDAAAAERGCAAAVAQYPLSAELAYLHAVLLLELGRLAEAARALRRVLYLDRSLALAHFTLGAILQRSGNTKGARRAYRNVRDLCSACPPEQILPLSDGEHAGQLAEAAEAQLALLDVPRDES